MEVFYNEKHEYVCATFNLKIMAKKIGFIEKDGVKYISVTDVFEYLREQGVIDTEERECTYRWNFEQSVVKLMHDSYKSGEKPDSEIPFIIEGSFYCHWTQFTYISLTKVIKAMRDEAELKKVVYAIDLPMAINKNKMFVKRTYAIR